jgi:branched-chain amino acid aminotransferase
MAGLGFVESKVAFLNGDYVPVEDAKVSVFDRGFLYGDGVYETLGVHGARIFRLDDHLDRLRRSVSLLRLDLPMTASELREVVLETVRRNGYADAYVRIVVSRGVSFPSMDSRAATQGPTVLILVHSRVQPPSLAGFFDSAGLRLRIVSIRKTPSTSLDPRAKTLNYLNQMLARLEATDAGADEALLLDVHGFVAEGAGDNFFAVHGTQLVTPGPQEILAGITRATVIELAHELGYEVVERNMTTYDVYTADEAFVTSTYGGILAVAEVNGRPIGDPAAARRVTEALQRGLQRLLETSGDPIEMVGEAGSG